MIKSNFKDCINFSSFQQMDQDTTRSMYMLNLHTSELEDYNKIAATHIDEIKTCDKVFVLNEWEAPYDNTWVELQDYFISQGIDAKNILIADGGINSSGQYNHIWNPVMTCDHLGADPNNYPFKKIQDRVFHFNSLARIPKPFRVLITAEIMRRKLDHYGLITCGTAPEGQDGNWGNVYELYVHDEIKYRFPCVINRAEVARANFFEDMVSQFGDCAIHLAIETSFENTLYSGNGLPLNQMWDRIFPTEKTMLSFSLFQLPLVLSVPGTVAAVRRMGFDMYDDIIDHSYDLEPDPERRIIMVVDELQRLIEQDVMHKYDLDARLYKNAHWVRDAFAFNWRAYIQQIHGWYYR